MVSKYVKNRVIGALRKASLGYSCRTAAKRKAKRGPAAYICAECEYVIYTGRKELEQTGLLEEFEFVEEGKVHVDHINPVVPTTWLSEDDWDWNIYIMNLFCAMSGYQVLCEECHREKTDIENKQRRRNKKKGGKKK